MDEYQRLKKQYEEAREDQCMGLAQEIIDLIIPAKLLSARDCAEYEDHDCIVVWSSGAQEQIAAVIAKGKPSSC